MRLFGAFLLAVAAASCASAVEFSGYAEAKGFAYAERLSGRDPWVLGWATLLEKVESRAGRARTATVLRAEQISSLEQGAWGLDLADRRARRSPVSVRELWARYPLAPAVDLQLGRFELGWGKTDGYSPADAFLPRDLSDPFADEKLPLWAARLTGQSGAFRSEVVACPVTTPWRLPVVGGRGAPLETSSSSGAVRYRDEESPPPRPGFGALRLLAVFGEWDVGAWGRFGVRPAPVLDAVTDRSVWSSSGVTVPLERSYARETGGGLEVSRVAGSWVLRGEAAWLTSGDWEVGDALIGTASAERSFGDGTLLVTLAGNAKQTPVEASRLLDRALLPALIAAWNRSEDWGSWKIVWTACLERGDGLLKAEMGYDATDLWKLTLGGELPYGSKEGPLGALRAERRVRLAVRRSW